MLKTSTLHRTNFLSTYTKGCGFGKVGQAEDVSASKSVEMFSASKEPAKQILANAQTSEYFSRSLLYSGTSVDELNSFLKAVRNPKYS